MQAMCHIVSYFKSLIDNALDNRIGPRCPDVSVRREGHAGCVDFSPFLPIRCA